MQHCARILAVNVLSVLLVLGLSSLAQATQLIYKSPHDLGEEAALVVRGKVARVESYWNVNHTKIFTRTRISVDETYKGSVGPSLDLVQLGGIVGNVKVTVQGALQWKAGEEVLVFAEPYDATAYQVAGFSQGKYRIERDRLTGVAYVQAPPLEGVSLVGAPGAPPTPAPVPQEPSRVSPGGRVTLEAFVNHALSRRAEPAEPPEPAEPGVER